MNHPTAAATYVPCDAQIGNAICGYPENENIHHDPEMSAYHPYHSSGQLHPVHELPRRSQEAEMKAAQEGAIGEFVNLQVRKVVAFEMIADALQTMARVQSERYAKEFPPHREPRPAEIGRASDDKAQQFSDTPTDEWMRETTAALPQEKSRFQRKFDAAQDAGTEAVPKE